MRKKDQIAALLEVVEQLHGWITDEFDQNPCPIVSYLGGTPQEMERWLDALGPLALKEPAGYPQGGWFEVADV